LLFSIFYKYYRYINLKITNIYRAQPDFQLETSFVNINEYMDEVRINVLTFKSIYNCISIDLNNYLKDYGIQTVLLRTVYETNHVIFFH